MIARLIHVAVSVILAACATSTSGTRFVVIESDAYGCGAVQGLGCGLAIAPVLESIDRLDGVRESAVSWDGRRFRIEVLPGADSERIAASVTATLEGDACCVAAPLGRTKSDETGKWFNSAGTRALSRHEADVIASEFSSAVAAEVALTPETSERLHSALRAELRLAFERAHDAGGGVNRLWDQLPQARAGFETRLEFLTPEQRSQVFAVLDRKLGER